MKKRIVFFIIILTCCLFFTCDMGQQERILERFIPPDALVVLQVQHPDTFFENIDSFIEPLGGIPLMGNVHVKDFLKSMIGAGFPVKFEWFDFTRPWGGALLPSENRLNDFSTILCIPVLHTADFKAIEKQALLSGFNNMKISDRYILLSNREKSESKVKPKKKINLSRFKAFDRGALACQLNIRNILAATGLNSELITNLLGTILVSPGTTTLEKDMKLTMGFLVKLFEAIEQTEDISAGILLNEQGMSMKILLQIAGQGWVNDCLSTLTLSSGIKEYLKYIPQEYLFSMVYNLNSDFLSGITERCYNFILPYTEIKADEAKSLSDAIKKGFKASGRKSAIALDIDFKATKPGDFPGGVIPGEEEMMPFVLPGKLSASVLSCIELKDTEEYRSAMEEIVMKDSLTGIINSFMDKAGVRFSIEYNKNSEKNGLTCDELGYTIDMSKLPFDPKEESGYTDMIARSLYRFLKDFFEDFKLYLGFKTNHCYLVSGESGIDLLKNFLEKDRYGGNTLLETDVYTHFESEIPQDAHLIGHFSIPRIISMIPDMPDIDSMPGFIFYGKYENTLFESGCYWDIGEIKTLYNQFFALIPQLMEGIPGF